MNNDRTVTNIFLAIMIVTFLAGFGIAHEIPDTKAQEPSVPSPTPFIGTSNITLGEVVISTPTPKPLTVEEKIEAMFPEDPETAVEIANCESTLNPNAVNHKNRNGSVDVGLMMINSIHGYSKEYLLDVDNNLKVARKLYDRQGWKPWVCSRKI